MTEQRLSRAEKIGYISGVIKALQGLISLQVENKAVEKALSYLDDLFNEEK